MGEKVGFMTVLLLFSVVIIPFLLHGYKEQVDSSKFLTMSNEIKQMVASEGGVTDKVIDVTNNLRERGIDIKFNDDEGNIVDGKVNAGEKITITYNYKNYQTENSVVILRR